jgi:hypothetical protein
MRKGGLEPKAAVEMIDEFRGEYVAVCHRMSPLGPPGANCRLELLQQRLRVDEQRCAEALSEL